MSNLVLELFSVNNQMLAAGDRLVARLGLTTARWQVLGTIAAAKQPQPVAWLARDMGANRQNIQRIVNDLIAAGLISLAPNPHHQRAPLALLTEKGTQAFNAAMQLQAPWISELAAGVKTSDLETTRSVLKTVRRNLQRQAGQRSRD